MCSTPCTSTQTERRVPWTNQELAWPGLVVPIIYRTATATCYRRIIDSSVRAISTPTCDRLPTTRKARQTRQLIPTCANDCWAPLSMASWAGRHGRPHARADEDRNARLSVCTAPRSRKGWTHHRPNLDCPSISPNMTDLPNMTEISPMLTQSLTSALSRDSNGSRFKRLFTKY